MVTAERRKTERHLFVIDATVSCTSGTYQAELLNINSTGVGISWIEADQPIPDGTHARIECHHLPLIQGSLSGLIKGSPPRLSYRPNERSIWLETDQNCRVLIDQMIQSCTSGIEVPDESSCGFRRAWNMLNPDERTIVSEYLKDLRASGSDERQIAHNLIKDENSPGHRVRNFLKVLLEKLSDDRDQKGTPLEILKRAFVVYEEQFSLNDAGRDRPIKWI